MIARLVLALLLLSSPAFAGRNGVYVGQQVNLGQFGVCNNTPGNDGPIFAAFNTWALANQGTDRVTLTIPSGAVCNFSDGISSQASKWTNGIKDLLVLAYGATLTNANSTTAFFFPGNSLAIFNDNAHSARLETANAGASCVNLITAALASLWSSGDWALITGLDIQGFGYPMNAHYFEYPQVSSVDAAHKCDGTTSGASIHFVAALKSTYESTWPVYNSGSVSSLDQGGPATLYAISQNWNQRVEHRGEIIDQSQVESNADAKTVIYRDVTFTGGICAIPSVNREWAAINSSFPNCVMEVDKMIGTLSLYNVTIRKLWFQSSSTDLAQVVNSNITLDFLGTPKKADIWNSTLTSFEPGATCCGRSDETVCNNCTITALGLGGYVDNGTGTGANNVYTMSGGTITSPNSHSNVFWAVPGTNIVWNGHDETDGLAVVGDITQDPTNTHITTNCVGVATQCGTGGNFPTIPTGAGGAINIRPHPAPKFTCNNCSGDSQVTNLTSHPGLPLFAYSNVTYTQSWPVSSTNSVRSWGKVNTFNYTVAGPYGGAGTLSFFPFFQFGFSTVQPNGSNFSYTPQVDMKTAGERTVTPSGVTGGGGADANLSVPSAVWVTGQTIPNISGNVGWAGSINIELTTDQGVINPP